MLVVVLLVVREDVAGVGLVHDEDVIEGFASDAADDAFAVRVHTGSLRRTFDDLHLFGPKDGIGGLAVLVIAVAQQEAQGLDAYAQVGGEIPRLLHRPVPYRVGGAPGDVQSPGAVLEEHQRVQPPAEDGVDVEEVCRDDPLGLCGQELASRGA
ncbi:hypothetical protein [Streptomyces javensis]|uniref:Uncharacterized protein n=1 Tax=Streptomyces javensis TaxID=114698 RepID=A0ABP4HPU2_9ACTN